MTRAEEYRNHAQACRDLADRMTDGGQKDHLLKMAEAWERLAREAQAAALHGRYPDVNGDRR